MIRLQKECQSKEQKCINYVYNIIKLMRATHKKEKKFLLL